MTAAPAAAIAEGLAGQLAAADPRASVWVAANAGAGKTTVLTNRVLRLLLAGTRPGAILCLTYTKAAAAEMANRLAERLGEWVMLPNDRLAAALAQLCGVTAVDQALMTKARKLFAEVLDAPGGVAIQTLHGFCTSLLKRFPLEAGVAPGFAVAEEAETAAMFAQARDDILTTDDAHLSALREQLIERLDEGRLDQLFQALIAERRKLRALLDRHGDEARAVIAAGYCVLGLEPGLDPVALIAAFVAGTDRPALQHVAKALASGGAKDQTMAAGLATFLETGDIDIFRTAVLTNDGTVRKGIPSKKLAEADSSLRALIEAEGDRLISLDDQLKSLQIAERSGWLVELGAALIRRYDAAKSRRGLLDYDDLILLTRDLLGRPGIAEWVLYKLDEGIDHLLVDEAQDTSPEQWDVVAALVEEFFVGEGARPVGRTVFAVGDEKQSIYSFQGAVPARFEEMRTHFRGRAGAVDHDFRAIDLGVSFRTGPTILAAVDGVFAQGSAQAGVARPGQAVRHIAYRDQAGSIALWPLVEPSPKVERKPFDAPIDYVSESSPRTRLAQMVAAEVAAWCHAGNPGDVMILMQRRDLLFEEIVRQLKLLHVPVAAADRMNLPDQMAVMDLIVIGRLLLQPDDDLTVATALKTPLFGFDDDDLIALCPNRPRDQTLWRTLRDRADERPHWRAAVDELRALMDRADYVTPYTLYAELLAAARGRQRLVARLGPEATDAIDAFLDRALAFERGHVATLEGFLNWLEHADAPLKRDMEQVAGMVRVMTVHGAKGLEAPIVILPDTTRIPAKQLDKPLLWPGDPAPTALIWRGRTDEESQIVRNLRAADRAQQFEEYRRLLYVAMTRAKSRLVVAGWQGVREPSPESWYRLVEPVLAADRALPASTVDSLDKATPAVINLPDWVHRPPPPEPRPTAPLLPSRPSGEAEPVGLSPRGDQQQRFRRGRLIHRLLQTLPDLPADDRAAAAARFLDQTADDLDTALQDAIVTEVTAVLHDPVFAPLFGPGSRAEVPVVGRISDDVVSGQIDRLVVLADQVLIVDFKTDRPPPSDPAQVGRAYLRQLALYQAVIQRVFPDHAVSCALLWTDGPQLMTIPAELLSHALAAP